MRISLITLVAFHREWPN